MPDPVDPFKTAIVLQTCPVPSGRCTSKRPARTCVAVHEYAIAVPASAPATGSVNVTWGFVFASVALAQQSDISPVDVKTQTQIKTMAGNARRTDSMDLLGGTTGCETIRRFRRKAVLSGELPVVHTYSCARNKYPHGFAL
jgi:hypothetical protein